MRKQQLRPSMMALAVLAAFAVAACDEGGGSGGLGAAAANGAAGGAGTLGTGGTTGLPGAGMGVPTGGTTGTAGVASTGGTSGAGAGGAAGMAGAAGMGGAAGTAGTAGTGGDGSTDCDLACDPGKHCELVAATCVQAPCPPQPECVDDPRCGGFAGLPCPGMGSCADDPNDSCDPMNGGADCGGICACNAFGNCPGGKWDSSPAVCDCVASGSMGDGETCGKSTCDAGMVCCNASCGICAPPDGACTQMACL